MSNEKQILYKRSHDFTPYTKADGQAVSDEFDAIQAALDKVPPLRDDGTGFSLPPIIPEPTQENHPVQYGTYLNGVKNVEQNRAEVERLANEVKQNAKAVEINTQAVHNNTQTVLTSEQNVINKERLADESENMARKWASNPEDEIVLDDKYSAYHYSQKAKKSASDAAQSETNAAQSETNANNSAVFAEEKANEAQDYMQQAKQAAFRENRWIDIVDKPAFNSSTTSNSETEFATPKAVKKAKEEAKAASLPITGGNLTGNLTAPYINVGGAYISVNVKDSQYGGLDIIRQGNIGNWLSRIEALPDKRWKFWTQDSFETYVPAKSGTLAIDHEVVHKTGDAMNWLCVQNQAAWLTIKSTGNPVCGIDFINHNGTYPQISLHAFDIGGWADELRVFTTPPGNDYNSDRRQHAMTIGYNGDIWTRAYGWLNERFMDKTRCYDNWYPNHYRGAQVFKIPTRADGSGIKIIVMQVDVKGEAELWLPEVIDGFYVPIAVDIGYARIPLGAIGIANNKIKVFAPGFNMTAQIHCIGWGV